MHEKQASHKRWGHQPDSDQQRLLHSSQVCQYCSNKQMEVVKGYTSIGRLMGSSTIHVDSRGKEGDKHVATEILQQKR